jgi:hypothetical protein
MQKCNTSVLSSTLTTVVVGIRDSQELSDEDIAAAVSEACGTPLVPCEIFSDRTLGPLECLVKHLRENQKMQFHEIAVLLKRDDSTIWSTYHNALRKLDESKGDQDNEKVS